MSDISAKVEDDAYPAKDLISDWNQDGDARKLAIARPPAIGGQETFDPTLATIAATFLTSVGASVTAAMIVQKIQHLATKRGLTVHVEEQGDSRGGEIEIVVRRKY